LIAAESFIWPAFDLHITAGTKSIINHKNKFSEIYIFCPKEAKLSNHYLKTGLDII
jgi:hypothetical protein